jgi:sugar (pentulose or hexulose) kinase
LGSLNSGLQLYRLKEQRPDVFRRIRHSYHLPQYLAALLHGQPVSEMTSIGCHTALWDFDAWDYHDWVKGEGLAAKLPSIAATDQVYRIRIGEEDAACGIGIHDSSSAMVPYIHMSGDPYLLLSTGTWSICFNPFNKGPLSHRELEQDCLNYISVKGEPVRASRLFAGNMYAQGVKELSQKFHVEEAFFRNIRADRDLLLKTTRQMQEGMPDLEEQAEDAITAYYYFMAGLTSLQARAIRLVRTPNIKQIFVEGGFCQNEVFMYMLATILNNQRIYAASLPQASALGAAMVLHPHWNAHPSPIRVPDFRYFPPFQ